MSAPIIILNWNGWDDTFCCLRSLKAASDTREVWLVDNNSDTDHSAKARDIYPELKVIKLNDNYGWAGGYNQALKLAAEKGYEFAYLLNNDCEVTPGFLTAALNVMSANGRAAAVGSRIAYKEPAGFLRFDGEYHMPGARALSPHASNEAARWGCVVNGAGMLVRLAALEEDGYFDERFFCYHEETEWCRRMMKRNWLCGVSTDSLVIHKGQGSDKNSNALYYRTRNRFILLEQCEPAMRKAEMSRIIEQEVNNGVELRRQGRREDWVAVACGLRDGLLGKFGRRTDSGTRRAKILFERRRALAWLTPRFQSLGRKIRGERAGDYVRHGNMLLPPRHYRLCGSKFHDDEYFLASAEREADRLATQFNFTRQTRILDLGCGVGRLAIGILSRFGDAHYYRGVDVNEKYIAWCESHITKYHSGFQFSRIDAHNPRYNPSDKSIDGAFHFPFNGREFDIVYLYSVFSHMIAEEIDIYLKDFKRILKPSGRLFITAFIEEGAPDVEINPPNYRMEWKGPLHCVRYSRRFFEALLNQNGFAIEKFEYERETDGQSGLYIVHRSPGDQRRA